MNHFHFYYLMFLIIVIIALLIFNHRAMNKINDQEDIIDNLNITISRFKTHEQLERDRFKHNNRQYKEEYLQLNIDEIKRS